MPRERGENGQYRTTVTPDDVFDVFDDVRGPVVTSGDVADALGVTRETARRKLDGLADDGRLDSRKTAGRVVYWRTGVEWITDEGGVEDHAETRLVDPPAASPRTPSESDSDSTSVSVADPDRTAGDVTGDALEGWEPDTAAAATPARGQTRQAAEYLKDGLRANRSTRQGNLATVGVGSPDPKRVENRCSIRRCLQIYPTAALQTPRQRPQARR